MSHTDRLYYAYLAEPAEEGRGTARTPAHLTLVPPFTAAVDVARAALAATLAGWRPFTVHAADAARFGPRRDVPVVLIEPVDDLRRLHEELIAALGARGVALASGRHVHERFVPHIRLRPALPDFPRIAPGRVFTIDHVALVRRADGLVTVLAREALAGERAMEVTRENAWATLTRHTRSASLRRHALAVEASVRSYARRAGEDEEYWGCAALLHDFDYEMHPTLDEHPQDGAPILREEGWPEDVIETVLSHAEHLGLPRDTPLKRTLFACDELSGFVHACGLVRPTGLEGLTPKSVRKKLKQPSFAAGVNRQEVAQGAELLGLDLDEHIANVIAALRPIAAELGLPPGGGSA